MAKIKPRQWGLTWALATVVGMVALACQSTPAGDPEPLWLEPVPSEPGENFFGVGKGTFADISFRGTAERTAELAAQDNTLDRVQLAVADALTKWLRAVGKLPGEMPVIPPPAGGGKIPPASVGELSDVETAALDLASAVVDGLAVNVATAERKLVPPERRSEPTTVFVLSRLPFDTVMGEIEYVLKKHPNLSFDGKTIGDMLEESQRQLLGAVVPEDGMARRAREVNAPELPRIEAVESVSVAVAAGTYFSRREREIYGPMFDSQVLAAVKAWKGWTVVRTSERLDPADLDAVAKWGESVRAQVVLLPRIGRIDLTRSPGGFFVASSIAVTVTVVHVESKTAFPATISQETAQRTTGGSVSSQAAWETVRKATGDVTVAAVREAALVVADMAGKPAPPFAGAGAGD